MRDDDAIGSNLFPLIGGESRLGSVHSRYAANQIDEAFMSGDSVATPAALAQPAYVGLALSARKLRMAFGVMAVALFAVVLRAGHVQIVQGADYARQAEGNRSRLVSVPVERGVMFDRTGKPLVRNMPDFSATVTPGDLPDDAEKRTAIIGRLAAILKVNPSDLENAIATFAGDDGSPVTVADNLTHEQAVLLDIEAATTPGIGLATGMRRDYVAVADGAPALSHVLGYEGRMTKDDLDAHADGGYQPSDSIGKTGLEKQYEGLLRGTYGDRRVEVDASGHEKKVIAEETGEPGKNLVLTIDYDLQKKVEEIFRAQLKKAHKTRGSVIVLQPGTGDVLAMVSEPAFDNNLFSKGITTEQYKALIDDPDHPMFPRAIAGGVASGSVFKPVVGAAAMAEGIINENTTVLSTGGISVGAWFFPDWKAGGHGITNLAKGIAESVNTFFYFVGGGLNGSEGLGVERIVAYAKKFGFGAPLGIDLPSEAGGFLPSIAWKESRGEKWYIGDTYHVAIGQGDIIVTPLQIAEMTATIANHGTMVRPHVLGAVTSADGTREKYEPQIINPQVVDRHSIDAVRKGMRQTVTSGSGRSLASLPVEVAGKTGTAQWNSKKDNHAWFTSFAPYDKPTLVVTVMIEEGIEGSVNATPVARQIYDWYFNGRKDPVAPPAAAAAPTEPAGAKPVQPTPDLPPEVIPPTPVPTPVPTPETPTDIGTAAP